MLWGISLQLALDRPLVGTGFMGPYDRGVVDRVAPGGPARAVHSIWFELLGEHGFPTFFLWVGLTVAGFYYTARLMRMTRRRPELGWAHDLARMAQVSIVAYLVSGSFLSLSYWDFYWTLLIVLGAAHVLVARAAAREPWMSHQQRGAASAFAGAAGASGWRQRADLAAVARPAAMADPSAGTVRS